MKHLLILFIAILAIGCADNNLFEGACGTPATVKNLTGLDGCGYVFQLEDGSYLEPVRMFWCGTPPLSEEQLNDPLYNFEFVDGKKVFIDYEPATEFGASACMVGQVVKITCLTEAEVVIQD